MGLSQGLRNRLSVVLGDGGKMVPGGEEADVWMRCKLGLS